MLGEAERGDLDELERVEKEARGKMHEVVHELESALEALKTTGEK